MTVFYTAPTAIRALMGAGDDFVTGASRKSLRLLATVGEPINVRVIRPRFRVNAGMVVLNPDLQLLHLLHLLLIERGLHLVDELVVVAAGGVEPEDGRRSTIPQRLSNP